MDSLWGRSVIAQIGYQHAIVLPDHRRLNAARADDRLTSGPRVSLIVADGHDAEGETVGVHWRENPSGRELQRMGTSEPAHAGKIFVFGVSDQALRSFRARSGGSGASRECLGLFRDIFGNQHDIVLILPTRRARWLLIVRGDAILHQRRFPTMRHN